jgi:hypothetical protein
MIKVVPEEDDNCGRILGRGSPDVAARDLRPREL